MPERSYLPPIKNTGLQGAGCALANYRVKTDRGTPVPIGKRDNPGSEGLAEHICGGLRAVGTLAANRVATNHKDRIGEAKRGETEKRDDDEQELPESERVDAD
jgi:hypothetical protein